MSNGIVLVPDMRRTALHERDSEAMLFSIWRVVYVVSGAGKYQLLGKEVDVVAGDFLIIRPGKRKILVQEPLRIEYVPFSIRGSEDLCPGIAAIAKFSGNRHELDVLQTAFQDACMQLAAHGDLSRAVLQIQVILNVIAVNSISLSARASIPDEIRDIADRLVVRPEERLNVSEMAAIAGLYAPHFTRQFRRYFGMAPMEFAIKARIDAARRLLEADGLSVKETAYSLNYPSPFAFSKQFRAERGYPPSRRAQRECNSNR